MSTYQMATLEATDFFVRSDAPATKRQLVRKKSHLEKLIYGWKVISGAFMLTCFLFLVLPLLESISQPPSHDLVLQSVDTASVTPPPPPVEEPAKEEPKQEEKPPELVEETTPLDLSQLELALNPTLSSGDGWTAGDFTVKLAMAGAEGNEENLDSLFSLNDLDQHPRIIYQPGPVLNNQVRKKSPGTVYVVFVVDQSGRVESTIVQKSSDSVFDKPALDAVKQWRFEPGKRNGQSVKFRMRVPISFPKGA